MCLHWDLVFCNMGFPAQWPVYSASTLCSLGECSQIFTSPDPSDTRFDHLCLLLIRLALGFKPTVAFRARADANSLKARNVIKCRYTPKSNTVHFRLGCWRLVFSKVSMECWSPISSLTLKKQNKTKKCFPVRCDLLFCCLCTLPRNVRNPG